MKRDITLVCIYLEDGLHLRPHVTLLLFPLEVFDYMLKCLAPKDRNLLSYNLESTEQVNNEPFTVDIFAV